MHQVRFKRPDLLAAELADAVGVVRLEFVVAYVEELGWHGLLEGGESLGQVRAMTVPDELIESLVPEAPEVVIVEPLLLAEEVTLKFFKPFKYLKLGLLGSEVDLICLGVEADAVARLEVLDVKVDEALED